MRYELSDYEWCVINPMLPNKRYSGANGTKIFRSEMADNLR
jgi:transposase